jgi:adenylate kinase family enzyme
MDDLEAYVTSGLREDEEVIRELNSSVQDTIDLFGNIRFEKTSTTIPSLWPYWVLDRDRKNFRNLAQPDARPARGKLSQSTTSMIVAAVEAATSDQEYRYSSGYKWAGSVGAEPAKPKAELNKRMKIAKATLEKRWNQPKKDGNKKTASDTFGNDDILTLSWHLDLFPKDSPVGIQARRIIARRIAAYAEATSGHAGVVESFNDRKGGTGGIVMDSAYNLLRFVRCMPSIPNELGKKDNLARAKDRAFYRFQSRLHDHLSFSAITDSRFDGSELAFCLEGMLQLRPDSVNAELLKRVMEVLQVAQDRTPYWSSDMPMVADHKGQVLYPSSVEIARSLLASISIFDTENARTSFHNSAGSKYLHLIKRYWQWLKTRRTTITTEKSGEILGWHSEHLNDTALIHTWETSHILEFCIAFRDQMLRYISRNLLVASRLDIKWPRKEDTWEKIVEDYEPATFIEAKLRPYAAVHESFIKPFKDPKAKKAYWSILLYGPPGTGKTEFAENIAGFLRFPLITITVSDFLAEGEGRMENRAKLIFDVLSRQNSSVVIFDEMDQFLLDRDSQRFREQDSAFQFLTPGMLTKFGALRKKASVLFIIATNYDERIDPAIKRTGRIDFPYLVLPPDGAQRLKIINRFVKINVEALSLKVKLEIIAASAFLAYSDLKRVASESWTNMQDFIDQLKVAPRNIQFHSYKDRFAKSNEIVNLSNGPRLELLRLFQLAWDAWGADAEWIEKAKKLECGKIFVDALVNDLLKPAVSGQSGTDFSSHLENKRAEFKDRKLS